MNRCTKCKIAAICLVEGVDRMSRWAQVCTRCHSVVILTIESKRPDSAVGARWHRCRPACDLVKLGVKEVFRSGVICDICRDDLVCEEAERMQKMLHRSYLHGHTGG